ncbi:alpha/beta hydrolase [Kitasatospora cinereorecta]|uniref:Alpha/beta fold hydrolase n=1 Tax=Kitasatospora cinereorecta TaxID=285560 RepID=A0ABW0VLC3_9ACTN
MTTSWDVREAGPADAEHRALLLPGGLCSAVWYEDVMAEPALARAGIATVAVTLPGFGGTEAPADVTLGAYARMLADFAAERRCDVLVGHSLGANVALEMAASGLFIGPVVLLSPTFSRADEPSFLGAMDRIGQVPGLGAAAWAGLLKVMPRSMKKDLPPARADALAADLAANSSAAGRRIVHEYYRYLDRHPALAGRLCDAGVPAWVVRGDHDEIGFQPNERRIIEACPRVRLVAVPDAGHAVLVDQPAAVAEVIVEAARSER